MANKATRTKEQSEKQKTRTYSNQAKKYSSLTERFDKSTQKGAWKKKLDYYSLGNKK